MSLKIPDAENPNLHSDDPEGCSTVESNHLIFAKWHLLEPKIVALLLSHLPYAMLSLVRRGKRLQSDNSPVTVLVSASKSTQMIWGQITSDINKIVADFSLSEEEIAVVLTDDRYSETSPPDPFGKILSIDEFEYQLPMGVSFGLAGPKSLDASATIGGQIIIERPDKTFRLFVSVFHPFLDVVEEGLQLVGYSPKIGTNNSFPILMPSQADRQRTLDEFRSICKDKKASIEDAQRKFEETNEDRYKDIIDAQSKKLC